MPGCEKYSRACHIDWSCWNMFLSGSCFWNPAEKKKNHCLLPINKFPVSRFVSLKGEKTRCENHVYTETMIETYHTVDLRYSTLQLRLPRLPWSCVWITCKILTRISDGTNTNCSWSEFWTIFCQVWLDLHWSLGMVTTS